jgi:predicted signal transduction protein with EAL and GGDEF domain
MGHSIGDKLLVQVALRLQECVRSGDTVARLGGDEFAFILSNLAHAEDATLVAEKVIAALSLVFELEGQEVYISASLGISIYPGDGTDADGLLRNADTAMFQAKEHGPAIYQFYLPQMNERAVARLKMETQLRGALARHEFVLHYQPKVSLVSGEITGFEALLRWRHPARGLVPPLQFISVLEDTGLIVSVGEWVVRTVCEQIKRWQGEGLVPHPISINLSARQFQQQDLDTVIGKTLKITGIDPRLLEFELTESVLMKEAETAANALQNLKAFGVQISMDDFGTGYSSLAYLKRFPLDILKIDRTFIRDVTTDPDDAKITVAMINLAHSLELKVVAEGVETKAQLDFLVCHGCDEMQGYYFSRPLPPESASQMLVESRRLLMS